MDCVLLVGTKSIVLVNVVLQKKLKEALFCRQIGLESSLFIGKLGLYTPPKLGSLPSTLSSPRPIVLGLSEVVSISVWFVLDSQGPWKDGSGRSRLTSSLSSSSIQHRTLYKSRRLLAVVKKVN